MARPRPYRRRRRRPWAVLVTVLALAAVTTWTVVLTAGAGASGIAACPPSAAGPPPGDVLAADALDDVAPAPPELIRVAVLNAGGQRGQANLVAAQLIDLGVTEAAEPTNDGVYPDGDMDCVGQLRFGPSGEAAASTLALVMPCMELVRDERAEDTVDVAVGTAFADEVLDQLDGPGTGTDGSANVGDGDAPAEPAPPVVDPDLLEEARSASAC
jgi:hypothetical protein